jgi:competence protein ComEC
VSLAAPGWLALAWYPALGLAWRRGAASATRPTNPAAEPLSLRATRRPALFGMLASTVAARLRTLARPTVGIGATGVLLTALTLASRPDGRLHIVVMDVGQGDAILVTAPSGATMLIDGGPDRDLLLRRLGERLPWWRRRIDVMILTHPHEDHVAGLVAALERYEVGLILDTGRDYPNPTYPRFLELARVEPGGSLVSARTGQRLRLSATTEFTLLYPTADDVTAPLPESDINNASVVGLLRNGGFTALLTGDAHAPVEAMLAERGLLGRVDVLKVGHHGSRSSSSPAMLAIARPGAAIISSGIGNDYGHPHQVTLDRLRAVPALRLHRTDQEGSIEVISDGLRYQVRSRLVSDPWRSVVGSPITSGRPTGSIAAWPSPASPRPISCLPPSVCPTGSSSIRVASAASPQRPPGSWLPPAPRSTPTSSRSPPCCTTSTSPRQARTAGATASSPRAG